MMVVSDTPRHGSAGGVSLDGLFQTNATARPAAIALIDPANRSSFTDGAPLRLTYAEANERVDRLSRRLNSFGMPAGSVVAVQLPNLAEAIISLLAILRSGLAAAPVPALWRRSDLVAALAGVSPKALITLSHLDGERPAEIVCEAAADLFELSFPCAFGAEVPDGVIALDQDDTSSGPEGPRASPDAGAISLVTFDADADGFFAAGRSDAQWLASGLATLMEGKIKSGDSIVTTVPPSSLAGLAAAFVPWLLCAGTLELVHGHAPEAVSVAGSSARVHFVSPAAAMTEIIKERSKPFVSCIAVHRAPNRHNPDFSNVPANRIVDMHCFGETAVIALTRNDAGQARPIPVGGLSAPSTAVGAPIVIETRIARDELWLRGPMIPLRIFSSTTAGPRLRQDEDGFVSTGFRCRSDGNGGLIVDAGPERVVSVGGLRFGLNDLQSRFSNCGEDIRVMAIDDPLLGQRLQIQAANPEATIAALQAAGHSRIVFDATVVGRSNRTVR